MPKLQSHPASEHTIIQRAILLVPGYTVGLKFLISMSNVES